MNKLKELPKDLFAQIIAESAKFLKDLKALYNTKRKMEQLQLSVELRDINQKICFVTDKMHTLLSSSWNKGILKNG